MSSNPNPAHETVPLSLQFLKFTQLFRNLYVLCIMYTFHVVKERKLLSRVTYFLQELYIRIKKHFFIVWIIWKKTDSVGWRKTSQTLLQKRLWKSSSPFWIIFKTQFSIVDFSCDYINSRIRINTSYECEPAILAYRFANFESLWNMFWNLWTV